MYKHIVVSFLLSISSLGYAHTELKEKKSNAQLNEEIKLIAEELGDFTILSLNRQILDQDLQETGIGKVIRSLATIAMVRQLLSRLKPTTVAALKVIPHLVERCC